jgi:N-methylhydantoinase B/oxoprolinase/acetone carboxylase alpha subunit
VWIRPKGEREFSRFTDLYGTASPSKFSGIKVHAGDQILIVTPGGGGFGDPLKRDSESILEDVREGFVSEASATGDYLISLDGESTTGKR